MWETDRHTDGRQDCSVGQKKKKKRAHCRGGWLKYETVLHSSSSSRVEFMFCQLLVLYTQIYCVYDCMCKFFSFQCHDRTCHPNLLLTKCCLPSGVNACISHVCLTYWLLCAHCVAGLWTLQTSSISQVWVIWKDSNIAVISCHFRHHKCHLALSWV